MAEVELSFAAQPAHVRTARQIAVALARRARLAESAMDSVRLAVSEACGLVVALQRAASPADPVTVVFEDQTGLSIDVRGTSSLKEASGDAAMAVLVEAVIPVVDELPAGASLAVVSELAPRLEVTTSADGVSLAMSWPTEAGARS
jgi:Histidine kinase-like ATPase domain